MEDSFSSSLPLVYKTGEGAGALQSGDKIQKIQDGGNNSRHFIRKLIGWSFAELLPLSLPQNVILESRPNAGTRYFRNRGIGTGQGDGFATKIEEVRQEAVLLKNQLLADREGYDAL